MRLGGDRNAREAFDVTPSLVLEGSAESQARIKSLRMDRITPNEGTMERFGAGDAVKDKTP